MPRLFHNCDARVDKLSHSTLHDRPAIFSAIVHPGASMRYDSICTIGGNFELNTKNCVQSGGSPIANTSRTQSFWKDELSNWGHSNAVSVIPSQRICRTFESSAACCQGRRQGHWRCEYWGESRPFVETARVPMGVLCDTQMCLDRHALSRKTPQRQGRLSYGVPLRLRLSVGSGLQGRQPTVTQR